METVIDPNDVFTDNLVAYLKGENITLEEVRESASKADDANRGGWSMGSALYHTYTPELIEKLKAGDEVTWAKHLAKIRGADTYQKYRAIAPFGDRIVVILKANHDNCVTEMRGDLYFRFRELQSNKYQREGTLLLDATNAVFIDTEKS